MIFYHIVLWLSLLTFKYPHWCCIRQGHKDILYSWLIALWGQFLWTEKILEPNSCRCKGFWKQTQYLSAILCRISNKFLYLHGRCTQVLYSSDPNLILINIKVRGSALHVLCTSLVENGIVILNKGTRIQNRVWYTFFFFY